MNTLAWLAGTAAQWWHARHLRWRCDRDRHLVYVGPSGLACVRCGTTMRRLDRDDDGDD